jgi:hypothetical protein
MMGRISELAALAGVRCGKQREQGRIKTVPEWRNWQTRQVQDLVLAREWRFESSFGHHTNQSKSSLPHSLLALNLLRVQFVFPLLYLVSRTAFAHSGSLLVLLAAVCCALRPGDPAMVWGPLKRNYGGMRARIRARHGVHRFSVQTLQTHRGSRVSDLRHVFVALRAC